MGLTVVSPNHSTDMSNVNRKRKQADNPDLLQSNLEDLLHNLRQQGGVDLAATAILDLARRAGLTLTELKRHKAAAPSFSTASWEDVHQLRTFSFPVATLPPSFHRKVMEASAQRLDVYQERGAHGREAARARLMDAWHVPVCAPFKGRLVDKPKSSMPETLETSGGEVEHEVYMIEGIILLVFELKLEFKNNKDHIAQVLLELVSAYKLNSNREFRPQPPVHAILTDLEMFYFIRYDGSEFTLTKAMFVSEESRPEFLAGMRRGYIGTLAVVEARSTRRGTVGDVSKHNGRKGDTEQRGKARPSLSQALAKARAAQHILVGCKGESLQSGEEVGRQGLLTAYRCCPKLGPSPTGIP